MLTISPMQYMVLSDHRLVDEIRSVLSESHLSEYTDDDKAREAVRSARQRGIESDYSMILFGSLACLVGDLKIVESGFDDASRAGALDPDFVLAELIDRIQQIL